MIIENEYTFSGLFKDWRDRACLCSPFFLLTNKQTHNDVYSIDNEDT